MNIALFKQNLKENCPMLIVLTLLQSFILYTFGNNISIEATARSYYGLLPEIFLGLYVVVTSTSLIAAKVQNGSLSYILSTPVKRTTFVTTQALYLVVSLFLMYSISGGFHVLGYLINGESTETNGISKIITLNFGLFCLALGYSSICFLFTSVFNSTKYSSGLGGVIIGAQIIFPLAVQFNSNYSYLGNLTLSSLFDSMGIYLGKDCSMELLALFAVALILYSISIPIFKHKDLPI